MFFSFDPVIAKIMDSISEQYRQANRVVVRPLPRRSDADARVIQIDNSQGEHPIDQCIVFQYFPNAKEFRRVGWEREVPARQTREVKVSTNGAKRPRRLPDVKIIYRQNERWWKKQSGGRARRTREPADPGPL